MDTKLELRHLRALLAVVEHGGYTRAARALGVAQSTVSEAVLALERALGTPVLDRGRRPAAPTPAGDALLPYARRMVALEEEALGAVARAAETVRGSLAVAANESVSSYLLPGPLAALRRRWPNVRARVLTGECADVRDWARTGEVDVAFVLEVGSGGTGEHEHALRESRLVLFVEPGHPLAGREAGVARLADEEVYLSGAGGSYHRLLREFLEAGGFTRPRMHSVGSVEAVKRYVLEEGRGMGALPEFAVRAELAAGTFAAVTPRPALAPIGLRAVLRPGTSPSPVVTDLMEALRTGVPATINPKL